jgi:hypothetical protein
MDRQRRKFLFLPHQRAIQCKITKRIHILMIFIPFLCSVASVRIYLHAADIILKVSIVSISRIYLKIFLILKRSEFILFKLYFIE